MAEGSGKPAICSPHQKNVKITARFVVPAPKGDRLAKKPKTIKPGTVVKVIQSPIPSEPEKAEIAVHDADHLYREIRVENTLEKEDGEKVKLKPGAHVDVIIEADPKETVPKR